MGQPIIVNEKPSVGHPGVVRFETNRALTGMGHERYPNRASATGSRPPDELARRLFDHGGVDAVHINGNVITADLAKGASPAGLAQVIENLYLYYPGAGADDAAAAGPAVGASSEQPVATAAAAPDAAAQPAASVDTAVTGAEPAEVPAADQPPPRVRLSNGLATTSLVFGILGFLFLPAIGALVAIVTGHTALRRIKKGVADGRGQALAAVILGWIYVVIAVALALYFALR